MQPTQGIHHITAFAKNPQVNADFYHKVLGQRLIKTTVNFDDPGTYHLYYGDEVGTPGTVITFFPLARAGKGERGNGEVAATSYLIPVGSYDWWKRRLSTHEIAFTESERFDERVLEFTDPEGTSLELVEREQPSTITYWADGPIPEEHAVRGFHGATLWVNELGPTKSVLEVELGYVAAGHEGNRYRFYAGADDRGRVLDVVVRPGERRARPGAGSVHHIAFRTVHDDEQQEYLDQLRAHGVNVTPVQDRQYFHSIYFREPNGVLFEIATDAPGFDLDEEIPELGQELKLPEWYEPARDEIKEILPSFDYPTVHDDDRAA